MTLPATRACSKIRNEMPYEDAIRRASAGVATIGGWRSACRMARTLRTAPSEDRERLLQSDIRFALEPLLALALCRQAFAERHTDPAEMSALAALAVTALDVVAAPESMPDKVRADLCAEVTAHSANAARVCGELTVCQWRLAAASRMVEEGSGDPEVLGLVNAVAGSLAFDQRRFADSARHFRLASRLHASVGDRGAQGRALVAAGRAYAGGGRFSAALSCLWAGLDRLDVVAEPVLALVGTHCLAYAELEAGQPADALAVIRRVGPLRKAHAGSLPDLRLAWLEGVALFELGRFREAARLLRAAADRLEARGLVHECALAHFDRARALVALGRFDLVDQLLAWLPELLTRVERRVEALAAIEILRLALERERLTLRVAKRAARVASASSGVTRV